MNKHILKIFFYALFILILNGCQSSWEDEFIMESDGGKNQYGSNRVETEERQKVLLLYSAGYNNLKGYLNDNISDLKEGWLPKGRRSDDALLVYTHSTARAGDYNTPNTPYLIKLYSDSNGSVTADTLITYPANTISSSAEQLNNVLSYIKDNFKARSYGMIFSSHATGYLPPQYYSRPSSYHFGSKSIGSDFQGNSNTVYHEIELKEFADAIPMELDYILFDACLMGGVEVAYELREKCRKIGFSQAEVLAWGLNYKTLTKHLLQERVPDPQGVCEDYFAQYEAQTGYNKSATISLADTEHIDILAQVCLQLFAKYRSSIYQLKYSDVQDYGGSKSYFFDMIDIIRCAGATDAEIAELQEVTDMVIPYKNTTGQYYSDTDKSIHKVDKGKFSGLSMYLPGSQETELDKYYRTLSWNIATLLIE